MEKLKTLTFKKIDAFTKGISSGNPAGYVYLNDDESLTENEMIRMARELKGYVNEIGYVQRVADEFHLQYYSAECKVAFCGHATIAIMYDLLKEDKELITRQEVFINVDAGKLSVFNHLHEEDAVYIMAPDPAFLACRLATHPIAESLGAAIADIDEVHPVKLIDGGLRTLLVPLKTLSGCLGLTPDQERLKSFCLENDIDIVLVFTDDTFTSEAGYRTRVFAPRFGYLEDPATGSGNSAFGYYLVDQGLWSGDLMVEQGPDRKNPNYVKLKKYTRNGKMNILFGGCATTRMEGRYYLHGELPCLISSP